MPNISVKQAKLLALKWLSDHKVFLEKEPEDARDTSKRHSPTNFGHEYALLFKILYFLSFSR